MRRNWLYAVLCVAIVGGLLLSACAPRVTEPTDRKVITFIWTQEFDTLNPWYTNMWFSAITQQLWNCWAWHFDDQNNPIAVLVDEIPSEDNGGISPDGTVITMRLRDDIVWSDGTPITSDDFVFTYNMAVDPNNAVASSYPYDLLVSVTAPDARTVLMTFDEPFAPWQSALWLGLMPAHVLRPVFESEGTIDGASWNLAPTVGCGPFVFDEWESGSFARFVANDNYWLGRPNIDEVFFRFVPDDAAQVAALLRGEGDLGTFIAYSDIPTLEAEGVDMINVFSGYNEMWFFMLDPETGHPALQDVRVRQAIALGFDRQSLVSDLLLDLTNPAVTLWDNTPYTDPSLRAWPYDPDRARALLDDAGWIDSNGDGVRDKDGVELVLRYGTTTREIRRDTQAVAQQQLGEIGVRLELFTYEPAIYFSSYGENGPVATGQLDLFQYSTTTSFPDPDTADWLCREIPGPESPDGVNWARLCDRELDRLFQLQTTQVDFEERQQTFWEISRMMYENVYVLGVWQDPDIFAIGPRLTNVRISGASPFFNIFEWDVTE